jgi:hypothetical protein
MAMLFWSIAGDDEGRVGGFITAYSIFCSFSLSLSFLADNPFFGWIWYIQHEEELLDEATRLKHCIIFTGPLGCPVGRRDRRSLDLPSLGGGLFTNA